MAVGTTKGKLARKTAVQKKVARENQLEEHQKQNEKLGDVRHKKGQII